MNHNKNDTQFINWDTFNQCCSPNEIKYLHKNYLQNDSGDFGHRKVILKMLRDMYEKHSSVIFDQIKDFSLDAQPKVQILNGL